MERAEREIARLDTRAIERVSGPAWEGLREQFFAISESLLITAPECSSELTTIYVKFWTGPRASSSVFAVAWLKRSSELVVGYALPDTYDDPQLSPAPRGMKYPGLTAYFVLRSGDDVPPTIATWAQLAYQNVTTMEGT